MAKKRNRKSYDLPPELTERLNELSEELGIPQGQLLALFGIEGLEKFERGELDIDEYLEPHVNSLRYRWRLNLASRLKRLSDDED